MNIMLNKPIRESELQTSARSLFVSRCSAEIYAPIVHSRLVSILVLVWG